MLAAELNGLKLLDNHKHRAGAVSVGQHPSQGGKGRNLSENEPTRQGPRGGGAAVPGWELAGDGNTPWGPTALSPCSSRQYELLTTPAAGRLCTRACNTHFIAAVSPSSEQGVCRQPRVR